MASTTIIRAKSSFAFDNPDGVPISIREGETFHKDSPRLEGLSDDARAGSFEPFAPDHDVEQATAAPGEKRGGKRRGKSQKSKPADDSTEKKATAAPGEKPNGDAGDDSSSSRTATEATE
jgi:hypothetical protein